VSLAVDLRRPASVIAERLNRPGNINIARLEECFAVVERLQLGELVLMLLDEIGNTQQDFRPFSRLLMRPRAFVKGFACSLYRALDVLRVTFGNRCEGLGGGRVDCHEGFSRGRIDPFAADEHLLVARGNKISYGVW